MHKIQVTAQQRANALEARDVMWPSVPPENVDPKLHTWRCQGKSHTPPDCGTVACFGGWAEWWPEFRLRAGISPSRGDMGWGQVSELFGPYDEARNLLDERGGHPADWGFDGTDHELVTNRLNWLIANSEVIA